MVEVCSNRGPFRSMKIHTKTMLFTLKINKNQSSLVIETNAVKWKFVWQKPMRNHLSTCIVKIGDVIGPKSGFVRVLRTDKNRYIEAPRVTSYRFLSIGILLEAILETLWGHLELKNRLGGSIGSVFWSEVYFPGSTPPILEGFGELLGKILEIFWYLFLI